MSPSLKREENVSAFSHTLASISPVRSARVMLRNGSPLFVSPNRFTLAT